MQKHKFACFYFAVFSLFLAVCLSQPSQSNTSKTPIRCIDCASLAVNRAVLGPASSAFSELIQARFVAPLSECRSEDSIRCSAALASRLVIDGGMCSSVQSKSNEMSLARMCDKDCQAVASIPSQLSSARTLAVVDVAVSGVSTAVQLVQVIRMIFSSSTSPGQDIAFGGFMFALILSEIIVESIFLTRYVTPFPHCVFVTLMSGTCKAAQSVGGLAAKF